MIINSLQAAINRFIWKAKPPRNKAKIIQQKVKNGRIAAPVMLNYYSEVHLL